MGIINSPAAVTIITAAVIILAAAFVIFARRQAQRKNFIKKAEKSLGILPNVKMSYETFASVRHFAKENRDTFFYIDDITWNDLDMDGIYRLINCCVSSCGDDMLMYMLRNITDDEKVLEKRDALAERFAEDHELRARLQLALSDIGRTNGASIYDRINLIKKTGEVNVLKYVLLTVLALADIALFFWNPIIALIGFVAVVGIDISIYLKNEGDLNRYLKGFSGVVDMIAAGKEIVKTCQLPEEYIKVLEKDVKAFDSFKRASFWVMGADKVDTGLFNALFTCVRSFFHLDMFSYNWMLREYKAHEEECLELFKCLGTLDACIAIASFRKLIPQWTKPVLLADTLDTYNIYHPRLKEPVANSLKTDGGCLLTGSNASGKSTFLKTLGIAAILSQSIYTVPAKSYASPCLKVMTSMAINDALERSESYFIVELKSIKRIIDESENKGALLCIIDEVLRGTNTVERIAASSQVLKSLKKENVICFAATHDVELTYILDGIYRNLHFEENIEGDDVKFDYILREGRTTSRNAIKLMEVLGFDSDTVKNSHELVEKFEASGNWD